MFTSTPRAGLLLIVAALLMASGCQEKKPAPPLPSQETVDQKISSIREQYQKADSSAVVGTVVDALPSDNLVAVQLTAEEAAKFKAGMTVSFLDLDGNPINHGIVVRVSAGRDLHVRYNDPRGVRAPHVNDVMLYVKQ